MTILLQQNLGFAWGEVAPPPPPSIIGIAWTMPERILDHTMPIRPMDWTMPNRNEDE